MTRLSRSNRALLSGLGLSLAIHLLTLLGLGEASLGHLLAAIAATPPPVISRDPVEAPKPVDDELALGIAESEAVTVTWIGFEDPTEHHAAQANTDQPALSRNSGPVLPPPEPSPPTVASAPRAEPPIVTPPPPKDPLPPGDEAVAELDQLLRDLRPFVEQLAEAASDALAAATPASLGEPGDQGEPSDRDSDPAAIAGTIDVVPGHPVARKGLEIKTVRPKWVNLTRMTTSPRNPTVVIKFRRNGVVAEADFAPGLGTGYQTVDGPLLDAIYSWRASGEALKRLPETDPNATLEVRIRVIMQ